MTVPADARPPTGRSKYVLLVAELDFEGTSGDSVGRLTLKPNASRTLSSFTMPRPVLFPSLNHRRGTDGATLLPPTRKPLAPPRHSRRSGSLLERPGYAWRHHFSAAKTGPWALTSRLVEPTEGMPLGQEPRQPPITAARRGIPLAPPAPVVKSIDHDLPVFVADEVVQ
jgi:hypothetical protein